MRWRRNAPDAESSTVTKISAVWIVDSAGVPADTVFLDGSAIWHPAQVRERGAHHVETNGLLAEENV